MHRKQCLNLLVFLLPPLLLSFSVIAKETLDLSGEWRLRLDAEDQGLSANWPVVPLVGNDRITLPNTTDRAGFGFPLDTNTMLHAATFPVTTRFPGVKEPVRADEHGYLVRRHLFVGPAWYKREIEIPKAWKGRPVALRIERAMWKTDAWLDGRWVSSCDSLVAEHRHELGVLTPGRHRLTVRVDNRMIHNLSTVTHAYGPETQSRWNGMIGAITLEAVNQLSIRSLAVFPAPDRRSVRVVLHLANVGSDTVGGSLKPRLFPERGGRPLAESSTEVQCAPGMDTQEVALHLREPAQAWDEFHPVRYRIQATLQTKTGLRDEASVLFGFRHIECVGKEMRLNGRSVFLRGTLDCAVYPKTGHPLTSVREWERVLGVVKEYGFNHVRFHTWCPPGAAFEAADRLGIYLQPEAPAWVDDWGTGTITKPPAIGRDPQITEFLRTELRRMSEAYGNHPSFVLCAIGNEFGMQGTDWERVNAMVEEIKSLDPRRLYSGCTARRALTLLFQGHAQVVSDDADGSFQTYNFQAWHDFSQQEPHPESVHTISFRIRVPRVILLLVYDRLPKKEVKFTRHNIFERDKNTCQYCGKTCDQKDLNLDHVIPRDRGGPTTWENIVCSCIDCNTQKTNCTPQEAAMHLIRKPKRPKWRPFVQINFSLYQHDSWKHFIDLAYWNVELGEESA